MKNLDKENFTGNAYSLKPYVNIIPLYYGQIAILRDMFQLEDQIIEKSKDIILEASKRMRKTPTSIIGIHIRANEDYKVT